MTGESFDFPFSGPRVAANNAEGDGLTSTGGRIVPVMPVVRKSSCPGVPVDVVPG